MKKYLFILLASLFVYACAISLPDKDYLIKQDWILVGESHDTLEPAKIDIIHDHNIKDEIQVLKFNDDGSLIIKNKNSKATAAWKWINVQPGRLDIEISGAKELLRDGNYTVTMLKENEMHMQILYSSERYADIYLYETRK